MVSQAQTPDKKEEVPKEKKEVPVPPRREELSDDDRKLQDDLNMLVERLADSNVALHTSSLDTMKNLIRASTTSMTSVPKPLKFMHSHYPKMKEIFHSMSAGKAKQLCADLVSVLAMTSGDKGDCINFRLKGMHDPIGDWGHEYVRHLSMEMSDEWKAAAENPSRREELLSLVRHIVGYNMKHNGEVEACDLLTEIDRLDLLLEYVEEVDHGRVCMYLLSCAPLTPDPDNQVLMRTSKDLYMKFGKPLEALRCAIMLNDVPLCRDIFLGCDNVLIQKQMAIVLGRHQIFLELEDVDNADKLIELNSNSNLHHYFHSLGRELDIMEPKTPEGIYKSHLEQSRPFGGSSSADSPRLNLAAAFVNGFVNCGFSVDKMMSESDDANRWFYKNKEYGMLSSAASQGLVWRWNIDAGLAQCDRFLYVNDDFIKAGTLLAIGIISSGIQDTCDPASALLIDHVHSDRAVMRIGSVFGLGLAYANSKRHAVLKEEETGVVYELKKVLSCTKLSANNEVKGLAGLSLGFVLVGTADDATAMEMLQFLMEKNAAELADPNMRFVALGIALIFLGTQEKSDVFVESLRSLPEPFGSMVSTLVDVCAYAGTGNVLKIQKLLHLCSEHYEAKEEPKKSELRKKAPMSFERFPSGSRLPGSSGGASGSQSSSARRSTPQPQPAPQKEDLSSQQAVAVLGIGLISMGEEIGSQMSLRTFGHLMRYGEPVIRRAVPLALSLISVSNPQLNILETLSKYSHDSDAETAHNAILALGLVGAGTNNARLVSMLRQLATYHHKDQISLMLVRIAQGLTHLGKGTMTLNPFHSDRQLMCPAAVAGLFATCFAFLDGNNSVLSNRQHYLMYCLVPAMQPRHLITLIEDEDRPGNLKQINVSVRVGQAVDVVAQAGKPKTITGFQTHTTPVLLAFGERAELATDEFIPLSPYLEGLVIVKKNPEYEATSLLRSKK
ncbi:hypothetical protein QR680_002605 [Steinernema hermaphroditum]|uniref:26S proteasome non-ATPase regulatory subunit 2 n=1 Tax=Steinernema hermaphroditum TaxID=289476 RepID=A0AA39H542_9BILA|nr:hypothetical protein QR680_002605 [Steinernema hermaphroditum]